MIPYSMNPLGIGMFYTDLDILRQIRDANPTSQLPNLWLDSEDPYTQWEGVTWSGDKVRYISLVNKNISSVNNIKKLKNVVSISLSDNMINTIDFSDMKSVIVFYVQRNSITNINMAGMPLLNTFDIKNNLIQELSSLTTKGVISDYNFTYNNLPTAELNRLRALGFTDESKLLPQNP